MLTRPVQRGKEEEKSMKENRATSQSIRWPAALSRSDGRECPALLSAGSRRVRSGAALGGNFEKLLTLNNLPNRDPLAMKKVREETSAGNFEARPGALDDFIQQDARQIVRQAIEAELTALPER